MDWQFIFYMIPLVLSVCFACLVAIYAYWHRASHCDFPLVVLMLAVAEWSLMYVFRLSSLTLAHKLFWTQMMYIGTVIVPGAWLSFALTYPGQERRLNRRIVGTLALEPLLMLLLIWVKGGSHTWFWQDFSIREVMGFQIWHSTPGVGYTIHSIYSYVLIAIGTGVLARSAFRTSTAQRSKAILLLIGTLFPLAVNSFFFLDRLYPKPYMNLTPVALTISGLIFAWSLYHSQTIQVIPVARHAIIEGMTDGVIILNTQNRIVDMNLVARHTLSLALNETLGHSLEEVLGDLPDLFKSSHEETPTHSEIALQRNGITHYYDFHVSLLTNRRGKLAGRVIVLHNITDLKRKEGTLRTQQQLLEALITVARSTVEKPTLDETLQNTLDVATRVTQAEGGSLFLFDKAGELTHSLLALGKPISHQVEQVTPQVLEDGLAGWVIQSAKSAIVTDTLQDERWLPSPKTLPDVRSALALPIVQGQDLQGVLTLTHPQPHHFTDDHLNIMEAATRQIGLALRNAQIFDAQSTLAKRLSTVYEVLRGVSGTLNPKTVPHVAVDRIARLTGWPAVAILMPDEQNSELVVQAATSLISVAHGWRWPLDQSVAGQAFTTGQPQFVNAPNENLMNANVQAEIAIPLRRGTRFLGVLDIQSDQEATFIPEDVRLAELLADAIALALDSARSHAEIGRYISDLGTMYTVARATSRTLGLNELLSETLFSALSALDFDAGLIALANPQSNALELEVEAGLPLPQSNRLRHQGFDQTLEQQTHQLAKPIMLTNLMENDPNTPNKFNVPETIIEKVRDFKMRAYVCIPLIHQERSLGVLSFLSHHPISTSPHLLALQVAIGQQIATAIVNARLFQAVEDERQRLQALIESSRDGILFFGLNGRILVANAQALQFLKLGGDPESWVNCSLPEIISYFRKEAPSDVQSMLREELDFLKQGDIGAREGEFEMPPRTIEWLHMPVDAGAAASGRLVVLRDVTEARLLEKMRADLTYTMVHDLRNPLTGIFGALKLLQHNLSDDILRPAQRQMLSLMQSSTQQMLDLVSAILDISQLESGRMPLVYNKIILSEVIGHVLNSQIPLALEKDVHLVQEVPSDLPEIWVDTNLIERVLQNLVGNALKFTSAAGLVEVKAHTNGHDTSEIRVCVQDTGEGIPTETRARLFQKFSSGQQVGSGSGLGLAFCKMALEAHGGRIWLEQTSPEGTTFCFALPVDAPTDKATSP